MRRFRWPLALVLTAASAAVCPRPAVAGQVEVKVEWYDPNGRWDIPLVCFALMREDPELLCTRFRQMQMRGGMGYSSGKVMAFSTGAGPDVFNMWTHQIASFKEQGFLYPLAEYVGTDANGNGRIDDEEARWDYWKQLDRLTRKIVTFDGEVYAIPARRTDFQGMMYRKDLVRKYGIPEEPAKDWDEFFYRMQKLTWPDLYIRGAEKQFGRRGMYQHRAEAYLYPWVWASGGNFVKEGKTNPRTGKTHWWVKEELEFIDPETGESLAEEPSRWKATLTTPEVHQAFDFLWKLFHAPWIRDPATSEPINLTEADVDAGTVRRPRDGSLIRFGEDEVIRGVARTYTGQDETSRVRLFERGEVVCFQAQVGTEDATAQFEVRPDQLGFWPVPPRTGDIVPVLYQTRHWLGLSPQLENDEVKRQKAWKVASHLGSKLGKIMYTRYMVAQGRAMFMTPDQLELAGLGEYVEEIPDHWLRDYERLLKHTRYQPFNPNWLQVMRNEVQPVFDKLARDRDYDYKADLEKAEQRANSYVLSGRPESEMRVYRWWAYGILLVVAGAVVAGAVVIFRSMREKTAASMKRHGGVASARTVYRRWMPWLLLMPALASVGLWAYFPLVRGTWMAFNDYRLMGESTFVGVDNWINIVLDPVFRESLIATFKYVAIALSLTFLAPIILAIMVNEIPWFKQVFRTVFFLPQVMASVVVMLLWTQMFDESQYGYLNQVVMFFANDLLGFEIEPIAWLQSTFWAPICVVIPGLWSHLGMGSLIYLAALKSVPEDIYEAADMDGAGLFQKIRHITIPTLYPLIVINFVGAFIGCFHQMQNIFVMTGGAAGTRVLSLHIWLTAYADLKFGPATATAWILGSMLIGFTVWQLRILRKVEFRRAAEN